ncbi:energy-coupling factor transporter transmembrane component T [Sporomusa termitida]|uniref:Energy-coupling factor transporter transmembrane protein EcfT n=1 Tax=Sporomusa termitida TaxID=2377 RepID=A0A517DRB3_9FIRM|nr:energy-coupling factor transporter transmembrane component T [Sporomusa termitida]QDR79890.1 Energy-coupling factor transporter transmembrane protein EcfT [Sporomusa termitida]
MKMVVKQEAAGQCWEDKTDSLLIGKTSRGLRDMDPRMKILMSLAFSTMLFFTAQKMTMLLSLIVAFAILLLAGKGRSSKPFLLAYAFCLIIDTLIGLAGVENIKILLSVFVYSCMKFIPVIMLGHWLVTTVKINDFITAMEQMGFTRAVIIPLAVLLRFLPTVKDELGYILDTMKMRNIELSFKGLLVQPVRMLEYILVPLLLRSVKLADELSAAALTRGIDGTNQRTSLREVRILFADMVIAGCFVAIVAALWYQDSKTAGLSLGWIGL